MFRSLTSRSLEINWRCFFQFCCGLCMMWVALFVDGEKMVEGRCATGNYNRGGAAQVREMLLLQQQQQQQGAGADGFIRKRRNDDDDGVLNRTVCVTSGISFIGLAIVNRLLSRGYTVRLALDTQEELEKVREMEMFEEHQIENYNHHHLRDGLVEERGSTRSGGGVCAVVADMMDMESLCAAFHGCSCVFHTSAFIDPTGVSGYSKQMAEIEARLAERVIEACVRTQSVRNCVFTSSLVACIWRQNRSPHNYHVDENCWSDETLCRDRKLWYALGKTMAEKAAWRAARGRDLKLVTLCPGFVTGPGFRRRNPTASIAYLKGAQEMLTEGLLATVEIGKLAEAHVGVYEAMGSWPAGSAPAACGRYICFDHAISRVEEIAELERQLGMIISVTLPNRSTTSSNIVEVAAGGGGGSYHDINIPPPPTNWFKLSNRKLTR